MPPTTDDSRRSAPLFADDDDLARLTRACARSRVGSRIEYRTEVPSTQDAVRAAAAAGAADGTVCVAEHQTRGRGRRGAAWLSPPGRSLLFSLLVRGVPSARCNWIGAVAAAAVARAVRETSIVSARVKWPNDVVVPEGGAGTPARGRAGPSPGSWRKLAGVLSEAEWQGEELRHAVVGIGVNVLHSPSELPADTRVPATSVLIEAGRRPDRRRLFEAILGQLHGAIEALCGEPERWEPARAAIEAEIGTWWAGRRILLRAGGRDIEGDYAGLDASGALLLECGGGTRAFADAEVLGTASVP